MRLNDIHFVNVFQHADFRQQIKGHLIGIIGRNGSGKSNILNALRFGFGGEVPGKTKDRILRWGAESGYVELDGTANGKPFHLERSAHTNRAQFTMGSDIDVTGTTKVAEAVAAHIGFDRDVLNAVFVAQAELDSILFDQASRRETAFLKMCGLGDTAKIHRDLGQLLSAFPSLPDYDEQIALGKAQQADVAGRLSRAEQESARLAALLAAMPTAVALQERVVALTDAKNAARRASERVAAIARLQQSVDYLSGQLARLKGATRGVTLESIDATIKTAQETLQAATAYQAAVAAASAQRTARAALQAPAVTQEDVLLKQAEAARLEGAARTAKTRRDTLDTLKQAEAAAAGLTAPPADEAELNRQAAELDEMGKLLGERRTNRSWYARMLDAISGAAVQVTECPLCGSQVSDLAALQERLRGKLAAFVSLDGDESKFATLRSDLLNARNALTQHEIRRRLLADQLERARQAAAALPPEDCDGSDAEAKLAALRAEVTAATAALHRYTVEASSLDGRLIQAESALAACRQVEADVPKLQTELQGMQSVRQEMSDFFTQITRYETQRALEQEQLRQAQAELEQAAAVLQAAVPDLYNQPLPNMESALVGRLGEAVDAQTRRQQGEVALATAQGQIRELQNAARSLEAAVAELERRRGQQADFKSAAQVLTDVRDWFHYANGPHAVSVSIMQGLTATLNSFLERMNAPYRALIDDSDLGYRCSFIDGRPMPSDGPCRASDLSGGQKMILAIAFRLASYCMFANKQGLLSLDEPTVYLDSENVGNFCNLLGAIREVAQQLDLQLFISTHERAVIPFMDTVIDLTPDKSIESR